MSINPGGTSNYGWNYSKPDKPGYSTQLVGTVLAIQEVQKMGYTMTGQPGAPEFWPDGNPKMNIRLALATEDGEIKTFTFQPAGKAARMGQKKSIHMDLFALTGNTDMMNLVGKTICIQTEEGYYGQGHPRPWTVFLVDAGPYSPSIPLPSEFKAPQVLANNAAAGGQVQAPQPQPVQQQYAYQQPPQPRQPQPQYARPQAYQPQPAYQYQPYQPVQPSHTQAQMDPGIMAAMAGQVFGGEVGVSYEPAPQPADPVGGGSVYDDEGMPF